MTFGSTLVKDLSMPSTGDREITYADVVKTPADYCVQCFFSGGKWSSAECLYKEDKTSLTLEKDHKVMMSTKMTYKDMFDDLAACKTGKAPTHFGSQIKDNQFAAQESRHKNCNNGYDANKFSDGIPTEASGTGFNFTFTWRPGSKAGDWCYISQPLPSGFSGGLLMTFNTSKTEFAMKVTTHPKVLYFNN